MKRIILTGFVLIAGFTQAQEKGTSRTKPKAEKPYINPVKLTKEQRKRPYMDEVLKSRDPLTPEEAERRRKNIEAGNPFKKYGYYPKVATLSKGKYLEFHDRDSIVSIGSVRFNRKTKEIVEFREVDLSDPDAQPYLDTAGRWFSPDPLSEEYSGWSPYNMVMNNPIKNIDPDGRGVLDNFQLLQNGQVKLIEKTDDKSDTLFASDKNGNVDKSKSVTVAKDKSSDGSIISSLATDYGLKDSTFPKGINFGRTKDAKDAANVFTFAAKNSDVEWGLEAYKVGKGVSYTLLTGHNEGLTPPNFQNQSMSKLLFEIHSHKNVNGPSPINGQTDGDYGVARDGDRIYYKRTGSTNYPGHYLFHAPNNGKNTLWKYYWHNNSKVQVGSSINLKSLR